jgi:RNA polymerase sigma factor (sigma-70 family)
VVATARRSAGPVDSAPDAELLRAFVRTRDEDAFTELVRRLGPMVLAVCRRVSGNHHLAEDSFQAAFLVLARRASDVRPELVRGWLYGVAVRSAREARTVSARRLARETPVPAVPDRADEPADQPDADALRILDEEIANLPEHLRAALLLCELEGVSRKRASQRLGIPEGTLSSRLAKARKLLAERLRKRGVCAPAAGLGVLAYAALAPRLVARTSALLDATAPLPAAVATISHRVLRTMLLNKLQTVSGALLFTFAVFVGGWLLAADPSVPAASPPASERQTLKAWTAADAPADPLRQLEALKWHLLRVDVEKRTLHISDTPAARAWDRNTGGLILSSADSQISMRELPVAKDATITLDGKKAELKNLHAGHNLTLKFAADKPTVTAIEATTPPRAGYVVKEVNVDKGTIVVTRSGDDKPLTLTVTPDAFLPDIGALKSLKVGSHVQLHLAVENGALVVKDLRVR